MIFIIIGVVLRIGNDLCRRGLFLRRFAPEVFNNRAERSRSHVNRGNAEEHDFRLSDNHNDKYDCQNQETERLAFDKFRILE